jgi:hypothetical protein
MMNWKAFGNDCSVIRVLSQNFLGRYEENHKKNLSGQPKFEMGTS